MFLKTARTNRDEVIREDYGKTHRSLATAIDGAPCSSIMVLILEIWGNQAQLGPPHPFHAAKKIQSG